MGAERFTAPEVMFKPTLIDEADGIGLHEQVFNCIQEMDMDNRMDMYSNIVLSGGSSMYPGFPTRLEREIKRLYLQRGKEECASARTSVRACVCVCVRVQRQHRIWVSSLCLCPLFESTAVRFFQFLLLLTTLDTIVSRRSSLPRCRLRFAVLKGNKDGMKKLKQNLHIEDPPRRKHMVFLGGAVLADIMKDRDEFWISKQEWMERGTAALAKCGGLGF